MKAPTAGHSALRTRWVSFGSGARAALTFGPGILLVGALSWPLYFSSSSFSGSWVLNLWFMWKQSLTIGEGHLPSLFFNYGHGVFYPEYAFYAGTLDALTAVLSLVLGHAPIAAYVITYLCAFAVAYGGWYWIGRLAGLGRWQAQVPGLVFITSSYYVTMIYAQGEWPEFIAISTIPLMVAAGLSIVRAGRLRMWPALALTIGCVFFAGSHVLTLVWGSTTIALVGLAIVVCVPQARREISRPGLVRLAAVAVPAMLVSAWFLIPAVAYQSSTWIASEYPTWRGILRSTMYLVGTQHLFTLSRSSASPFDRGFALSLPVLAMAWALVGIALALPFGLHRAWTRILLICASFTVLTIVWMTHAGLILALPRYYATMQYSYRLEPYALLGVSGTVLAVLVLARDARGGLRSWVRWALAPVLVVAVTGAIQQVAAYPSTGNRNVEFSAQPPVAHDATAYEATSVGMTSAAGVFSDYIDVEQPTLRGAHVRQPFLDGSDAHPPILHGSFEHLASVHFDTTAVQGAPIPTQIHLRPGERVNTNLFGSPGFVHVAGARIVGINAENGADVLEGAPAPPSTGGRGSPGESPALAVTASASLPVVLGRVLTPCAMIALILQFGLLALRRYKELRRTSSTTSSPPLSSLTPPLAQEALEFTREDVP